MSPEQIKSKVQEAYTKALQNRSLQISRSSSLSDLFRDVRLYGREAGADFVRSHLDRIVSEAVETAKCKALALELQVHGHGQAALEGMAETLQKLTAMKVETNKFMIKLIWAESNPGLI